LTGRPDGDPLSDVLGTVRLTGAVFFMVDFSSPWPPSLVPEGTALARALAPHSQNVISYHLITAGSCWAGLYDGTLERLDEGDVVVFPQGDRYFLSMDREIPPPPDVHMAIEGFRAVATGRLPFLTSLGGGGPERMRVVCGFLGCDHRPFNPLLASLPPILIVRRTAASRRDRLERLLDLVVAEAEERQPGGESVRVRLSELMFVEVIRRHLFTMREERTGWLAGLRDEVVGRALALLHRQPARAWSLPELAREIGASRSVLAERFARLVGQPPMHYLTWWRMQAAARLLADGAAKISAVALEVGYDSEAAFSRAFKKAAGVSPATWRRRATGRSTPPRAAPTRS
jgi:AraC-like DNA-binding protein